jgi:hypothetical protein
MSAYAAHREGKRSTPRPYFRWGLALAPVFLAVTLASGQASPRATPEEIQAYEEYKAIVARTSGMVQDAEVRRLAARHGLDVMNLTWEDTARYQNSAVGPNISDMTIQIQQRDPRTGQYYLSCMPVIRFPNFTDKTADIDPAKFSLLVGNEKGQALRRISLIEFLANPRKYLSDPKSWKSDNTFLHANRDTHVLVSAQACFLPVPKHGLAEFNPVLFNYQSMKQDPAVLTLLVTREGTSVTEIDNVRDGFQTRGVWGQRLFFNNNGQRSSLTGQRLSDFQDTGTLPNGPRVEAAGQGGLNMVMLIQVPLKQRRPMRFGGSDGWTLLECAPVAKMASRSDVEAAVIGHGLAEGPFTEIDNLDIQRDSRYPIRVTVQFYKATSNGVVTDKDMTDVAEQIRKVYQEGDYVGSLVVDGPKGRPTEYQGDKVQPPDWWARFWVRHLENTGQSRQDVIEQLRKVHGQDWVPVTETALAAAAEELALAASQDEQQFDYRAPSLGLVAVFAGLGAGWYVRRQRRRKATSEC